MDKSWKNLLQELCYKATIKQPIYKTIRVDNGKDHAPIWHSVCTILDNIFEANGNTIKEAELNCAKLAYEYYLQDNLTLHLVNNKRNIIDKIQKVNELNDIDLNLYSKIILVDGENIEIDQSRINEDMLILIFVAKNTTKNVVFELQKKFSNYFVFISDCVGRDAADHLLTFYAGKLSIINNNKSYYVFTRDHYGEFIEKFMNNCKYICSLNEIK